MMRFDEITFEFSMKLDVSLPSNNIFKPIEHAINLFDVRQTSGKLYISIFMKARRVERRSLKRKELI